MTKTILSSMILACSLGIAPLRAGDPTPHLLFVIADEDAEGRQQLTSCEQMTIDKYKEQGTTVTIVTPEDLKTWLKGEGKPYAKGHPRMQQYHLARSRNAIAVGGLTTTEVSERVAVDMGVRAGRYVNPWGFTLAGCKTGMSSDRAAAGEVRALPLQLGDEEQPWGLSRTILARFPETVSSDIQAKMHAGRPFLGVRTEGNVITAVTNNSPAHALGLRVDDKMLSLDGQGVETIQDVVKALESKKPGDAVEVVYERQGARSTGRAVLADYHEVVNIRNSPIGKPIKELKAQDLQGRDVSWDQLRGKVVMVDFWATWCEPCKYEMPVVQAVWEKYRARGLEWLGVSVDTDDANRTWKAFVERNGLGGVHVRSPEYGEAMNVSSYPTILMVDRQGIVRASVHGAQIAEVAEALLSEGVRTSEAVPNSGS